MDKLALPKELKLETWIKAAQDQANAAPAKLVTLLEALRKSLDNMDFEAFDASGVEKASEIKAACDAALEQYKNDVKLVKQATKAVKDAVPVWLRGRDPKDKALKAAIEAARNIPGAAGDFDVALDRLELRIKLEFDVKRYELEKDGKAATKKGSDAAKKAQEKLEAEWKKCAKLLKDAAEKGEKAAEKAAGKAEKAAEKAEKSDGGREIVIGGSGSRGRTGDKPQASQQGSGGKGSWVSATPMPPVAFAVCLSNKGAAAYLAKNRSRPPTDAKQVLEAALDGHSNFRHMFGMAKWEDGHMILVGKGLSGTGGRISKGLKQLGFTPYDVRTRDRD